jgi:tripartite-type tricarboxylate transporter receptor subunit TctC
MLRMLMAASLMALMLCNTSWSQMYPSHPVRIVVGFGTGGPDTTARILAAQLTTQMGQSFVIDNRPGASGTIGAEIVAKAAPDGYTLMIAPNSFAINPSIYKKLPFDVIRDFTPISHTSSSEAAFLAVHPSVPVQNLKELIAYARKPENKVAYGSPGIGSGIHLRSALFSVKSGAAMVHVPYKGAGPAITALMSGEVQVMFVTTTAALPLIKSGKIRALAYDYATRAPFLPEVPTMAEAGAPATQVGSGWHGLFAPARTPAAIVARLESEVRKAVAVPEVQQQFTKLGLIPVGSTSAEFRAIVASTVKSMSEAVRAAGIVPE